MYFSRGRCSDTAGHKVATTSAEELEPLPVHVDGGDRHQRVQPGCDLRRQLGEIAEELEEQPCRRVPSRRADRPGVHADEVEFAPGELVPSTVQGVELEVPVRAGRRGVGAAGIRGEWLDRVAESPTSE
jgi:hypothetical protein